MDSPCTPWIYTFRPVLSCWSSTLSSCFNTLLSVFCRLSWRFTSARIALECATLVELCMFIQVSLSKLSKFNHATHWYVPLLFPCFPSRPEAANHISVTHEVQQNSLHVFPLYASEFTSWFQKALCSRSLFSHKQDFAVNLLQLKGEKKNHASKGTFFTQQLPQRRECAYLVYSLVN